MPAEQQIKLLVPAQCAGAIIGKQGSTLKQIRESLGPQGTKGLATHSQHPRGTFDQGTGARVEVQPAVGNSETWGQPGAGALEVSQTILF